MTRGRAVAVLAIAATIPAAACQGPRAPRPSIAAPETFTVGRDGFALAGVAGDGDRTYAALTKRSEARRPAVSILEARQAGSTAWSTQLTGRAGPLVAVGGQVFVTLSGHGALGPADLAGGDGVRGEPGGAVVAVDARSGEPSWRASFHASEWVVITAASAAPDGLVVAGSFSGSLRAGDRVVSSGGRADGFVAKLTSAGEIAWLVRMGGAGADAVQGVAAHGSTIAIAGTFAAGADLLGHPLPAFDEKMPFTDGFVAALDAAGGYRWSATFGGKRPDAVTGVAIDGAGRIAVAAAARDTMKVGSVELAALGPADGLLAWWDGDGSALHATLLGGPEFDGLRAITAVGERVVVGGFYSGTLRLGDRTLTAGGGDGAFLAAYDPHGAVVTQWELAGEGREEIVALSPIPGGFVAGVAYTASLAIDGDPLPAPGDPLSGAAVLVRPVH